MAKLNSYVMIHYLILKYLFSVPDLLERLPRPESSGSCETKNQSVEGATIGEAKAITRCAARISTNHASRLADLDPLINLKGNWNF